MRKLQMPVNIVYIGIWMVMVESAANAQRYSPR